MEAGSRRRTEPRGDRYETVVIGGGLGGLSAAAVLAKAGRQVLLLERTSGLGGCAHGFERDGYVFDPAVHYMGAAHEGAFIDQFLRSLGVRERVRFIPFDSIYGVDFPDLRLTMPRGLEQFIEEHQRAFPGHADGIAGFLEACAQMTAESQQLPPRLDLRALDEAAKQFPFLFKYRKATTQEVLDEFIDDPRVKALCSAAWPYVGLPPSTLSFSAFASVLLYVLEGSPHYCEGSFQSLVDAFAAAIEENGGEIVVDTPVEGITVEDGRATAVTTEAGHTVRASTIVSNADARSTLEGMVGLEHLPPRYVRRLERMTPSLSGFWLFAATTLDCSQFGLPHETFIHRHWDHDENFRDVLAGKLGGSWLSIPTLFDPSVAPPGEHSLVLTSHMPYDIGEPWPEAKPRYEQLMVDEVERLLPGFKNEITHLESATPEAFESWTGNYRGAIYGWENTPNQSTPKRLPRVTPIEGLLLSGHWTDPGCGAVRCIYSGLQTAQLMLGYDDPGAVMAGIAGGAAEQIGSREGAG